MILVMFQRTKQLSNLEEEQLGLVWKTYLTDGYRRICSMGRAVTHSPVQHVQVQVADWLTEYKVRMTTSNCSSRFPGARIYMIAPLHAPAKTYINGSTDVHRYTYIHKVCSLCELDATMNGF